VPVPVASPVKQAARIKAAQCAKNQFSCEWPRLSEKVNELKRLLNHSSTAAGGGQAEEGLDILSSLPSAQLRTRQGRRGETLCQSVIIIAQNFR